MGQWMKFEDTSETSSSRGGDDMLMALGCCLELTENRITIFDTGPGMDGSYENSIVKWGKMGASLHRLSRDKGRGGKPPYLTLLLEKNEPQLLLLELNEIKFLHDISLSFCFCIFFYIVMMMQKLILLVPVYATARHGTPFLYCWDQNLVTAADL